MADLISGRLEVDDDFEAVQALYLESGWTDGLPIMPPTLERVEAMLASTPLSPQDIIGEIPPNWGSATVEKLAVNAMMAGCRPEYLPVIIAAVEAMCDEVFNLYAIQATTHPCAPLIIVNGPICEELGLHGGSGAFGPGWQPNATIGRAVRLMMINVFEQRPGLLDQGCMGSLAKHGVCFGEDEEGSPWSPFHVSRGFKLEDSTVTVATIQDPEMVCNRYGLTAESVMDAVAEVIASHGMATFGHQWIWIVGYWHAQMLWNQGWDRPAMRQYVWERAWRTQAHLKRIGAVIGEAVPEDETIRVYAAGSPEDIFIMAGGGDSGSYSEVIMIYNGVPAITNIINETSG